MPTKIFTILGGDCPFGRKCAIDSASCRQCPHFYRAGTATFFWCRHPVEKEPANAQETLQLKRKRGRPPGKAVKRPVKRIKKKK